VSEGYFQKALERVSQTSFLSGNSIQILQDGSELFEEVFAAVEKAERLICLEYYIFRDDETGWSLADLLARKSREGVNVYLIYDHFGSISTSKRFWQFLNSHGIRILPFHPPRLWNVNQYFHRDHRKLAVIDGAVAFTGGLNVGDEYRGYLRRKLAGWRDTAVKVKGPIAGSMLEAFQDIWREAGGGEIDARVSPTNSESDDANLLPLFSSSRRGLRALRQLLLFGMHAAKKSIHLTMAYFIPSRKFLLVILQAARRGVDVKIIVPGQTDLRVVAYVSRTYYKTLLARGVQIYHYQPRVLHAKTMVVDGYLSIIGSANLDARSLNYNYECGVGVLHSGVAEEMEKIFASDLADSALVTEEEIAGWPLHQRALGTFFSWFRSYL
jgi:cardiolipin synthase A/B